MSEDAQIASLVQTARALSRATDAMRAQLDEVFASHCSVARLSEREVIVMVDSPVWASRMRYLIPQLQQIFGRYLGAKLEPQVSIKVHARPPDGGHEIATRELSEGARDSIEQAAQSMPDGRLRAALQRIARSRRN